VKLKESLRYQELWPECSARMSALEGNVLQNPFAAPRKRNYQPLFDDLIAPRVEERIGRHQHGHCALPHQHRRSDRIYLRRMRRTVHGHYRRKRTSPRW
jgi:hypothetical protein